MQTVVGQLLSRLLGEIIGKPMDGRNMLQVVVQGVEQEDIRLMLHEEEVMVLMG